MNDHFRINGSPTVDGYYTTYAPDEVTIDASEEGGGGSSDFSLANVTVRHVGDFDELGHPDLYGLMIIGTDEDEYQSYVTSSDCGENIHVVLYKGVGTLEIDNNRIGDFTATVEGNATIDGSLCCEVTGDFTLIISPRE